MSGITASANTGQIKIINPGESVTESAYLVSFKDGKTTLEIIDSQAVEIMSLRNILFAKSIEVDKLIVAVDSLNVNRLQERSEWQKSTEAYHKTNSELEKKYTQEKNKHWGIGPFLGAAHNGDIVIGIGLTYSIIRF